MGRHQGASDDWRREAAVSSACALMSASQLVVQAVRWQREEVEPASPASRAIVDEEAEDEAGGSSCAGRQESCPVFLCQRFANTLVGRPRSAAVRGKGKAETREAVRVAEVCDLERRNAEAPDVAGERLQRWNTVLGEVAIPLRPQRLLVSSSSARYRASTTARAASGCHRAGTDGREDRRSEAGAGAIPRWCRPCRRRSTRWSQTAPWDSSSETTLATRRAWPRAIRSSGL